MHETAIPNGHTTGFSFPTADERTYATLVVLDLEFGATIS